VRRRSSRHQRDGGHADARRDGVHADDVERQRQVDMQLISGMSIMSMSSRSSCATVRGARARNWYDVICLFTSPFAS